MPQITCKKKIHFLQHEFVDREFDGTVHKVAKVKHKHIVEPSYQVQQVPEWVIGTEHFKLLQKDGTVTVVSA